MGALRTYPTELSLKNFSSCPGVRLHPLRPLATPMTYRSNLDTIPCEIASKSHQSFWAPVVRPHYC